MKTFFATPEKTKQDKLLEEIQQISNNIVMSELLETVSGLLAILDKNRQIISINDEFLNFLGLSNATDSLGLRPGEILNCSHAKEDPAGCGTTKYCSNCGAAIAIVSSLKFDKVNKEDCIIESINKKGEKKNYVFSVISKPVTIDNNRFLLLFLKDITKEQQRAALERTFFHDINNILTGLIGTSELLTMENDSKLAKVVHRIGLKLHKEISIQRCLMQTESFNYKPEKEMVKPQQIIEDLKEFFENNPLAYKKEILFPDRFPNPYLITDVALVSRILTNMLLNALEAIEQNDSIKFWLEFQNNMIFFNVWNNSYIPDDIAARIFQKNFSTKQKIGRGLGSYSMKLFGEKILGGKVGFTTSKSDGTTFTFSLPISTKQ